MWSCTFSSCSSKSLVPDYGFGGLVTIRDFELRCGVICEWVVTICNPYLSEIGNFVKPNTYTSSVCCWRTYCLSGRSQVHTCHCWRRACHCRQVLDQMQWCLWQHNLVGCIGTREICRGRGREAWWSEGQGKLEQIEQYICSTQQHSGWSWGFFPAGFGRP